MKFDRRSFVRSIFALATALTVATPTLAQITQVERASLVGAGDLGR